MSLAARSDDAVLRELLARARPARDWPQFLSLAGARQYRLLYQMVRRHVPPGAAVLDWGSGNGHFSYFLTRTGRRATGFSIEGVSRADWLEHPYERFVGGDAGDPVRLPFGDAEFDAVASVGVLEHVRETGGDEQRSVREIARVLRPGGVFLCYHLPNRTSWIDFVARRVPGRHHHDFRYASGEIRALTGQAGLELVELHRYGILPRNSLHRLLGPWREARWPADLCDGLDAVLAAGLAPLCQNFAFVARKPRDRAASAAPAR